MAEPKTYEISTFENLLNVVNKENIDRLSIDLLQWLHMYADVLANVRDEHPKETEGKQNWEICPSKFTWIDDGKNDFKAVNIVNLQTGEVKKVDLERNKN